MRVRSATTVTLIDTVFVRLLPLPLLFPLLLEVAAVITELETISPIHPVSIFSDAGSSLFPGGYMSVQCTAKQRILKLKSCARILTSAYIC